VAGGRERAGLGRCSAALPLSLPSPSLNSHLGQFVRRTAGDLGDAQGAQLLLQLLKLGGMSGGKKEGVSKGGAAERGARTERSARRAAAAAAAPKQARGLSMGGHSHQSPRARRTKAMQAHAQARAKGLGPPATTRAGRQCTGGGGCVFFLSLSIGRAPALSLSLRPAPLSTRTFSVSSSRDLPRSSRALTMV